MGGGKNWTKAHCCCYINLDTRMGIFLLIMITRCWASGSIFFPRRALAATCVPAETLPRRREFLTGFTAVPTQTVADQNTGSFLAVINLTGFEMDRPSRNSYANFIDQQMWTMETIRSGRIVCMRKKTHL